MQQHALFQEFTILRTLSHHKPKLKLAQDQNQDSYVLKIFDDPNPPRQELIDQLVNLSHTSLVRLFSFRRLAQYTKKNGAVLNRSCYVYEDLKENELFKYVTITGPFTEAQSRFYFSQIVAGLQYLHEKGLAHGHLSAENIFFENVHQIKITDIGLNLFKKPTQNNYSSPEFNHSQKDIPPLAQDIFAAGVILFSMVFGTQPFTKASVNDTNYKSLATQTANFWMRYMRGSSIQVSESFMSLIEGMLCPEPSHRLTIQKVRQHPWLEGMAQPLEQKFVEQFERRKEMVEIDALKQVLKKRCQLLSQGPTHPLGKYMGKFRALTDGQGVAILQKVKMPSISRSAIEIKKEDAFEIYLELHLIVDREEHKDNVQIFQNQGENFKLKLRMAKDGEEEVGLKINFYEQEGKAYIDFCQTFGERMGYHKGVRIIKNYIKDLYQNN